MAPARARPEHPAVDDDRGWALLALVASGALFVALATDPGAMSAARPGAGMPSSASTPGATPTTRSIPTPAELPGRATPPDARALVDAGARAAGSGVPGDSVAAGAR